MRDFEKLFIDGSIHLDNIALELVELTVWNKIKELKLRGKIKLDIRNLSNGINIRTYSITATNKSKSVNRFFDLNVTNEQVVSYSLNKLTSLVDNNSARVTSLGWGHRMG